MAYPSIAMPGTSETRRRSITRTRTRTSTLPSARARSVVTGGAISRRDPLFSSVERCLTPNNAVVSKQHVCDHTCEYHQQGLIGFLLASSARSTTGRAMVRCGTSPWTDSASPSSPARTAAAAVGAAGSSRSTATAAGRSIRNVRLSASHTCLCTRNFDYTDEPLQSMPSPRLRRPSSRATQAGRSASASGSPSTGIRTSSSLHSSPSARRLRTGGVIALSC